jgi:hypothetical protein
MKDQKTWRNIAPDFSISGDVGFCQIGKWANEDFEAQSFARAHAKEVPDSGPGSALVGKLGDRIILQLNALKTRLRWLGRYCGL